MGARRLGLGFHRVDGRVERIRLGTARPTRDPRHLAGLFIAKLETVDPGFGVEDMILALYAAEPLPAEQMPAPLAPSDALRAPPPPLCGGGSAAVPPPQSGGGGPCEAWWRGQGAEIAPLLDVLGARLGLDAIGRIAAHASHIPERASRCIPVAGSPHPNPPPLAGEGVGHIGAVGHPLPRKRGRVGVGVHAKPPRPIRLFAPPEPVEAAAWVLPDDPPFRFTWRRRPYRVSRADGPERIAEEWWVEGGSLSADAVRDYYRVEDEDGRRLWIFRAGLAGDNPPPRWFVHGVFA
jgi:protein ImuB